MKKHNLILIGFMGIGKGSLARELQKALNTLALDTDDLIESFTNMSVKKIFDTHGESYFRKLEQRVVDWINTCVDASVISTGGGLPIYANNMETMGQIVYLKADFNWIYTRLTSSPNAEKKIKKRPLFQSQSKAEALLEHRKIRYEELADVIVEVSTMDETHILEYVVKHYKTFCT
jgi:shikimate kinase